MNVHLKRAYESAEAADGRRILVDRLWPRGVSKEKAKIDLWLKDVAPSSELRKWFDHDPAKWDQFRERYRSELSQGVGWQELAQAAKEGPVTLVYAAHDEDHNNAVFLRELLMAAPSS